MGCMRDSHSPFSFFVGINSCHASSHAIPAPRFPLLRLMLLRGCWRRSPSSRRCVCHPCSSLAESLSFHSSPPVPTMRGGRVLVWRLGLACHALLDAHHLLRETARVVVADILQPYRGACAAIHRYVHPLVYHRDIVKRRGRYGCEAEHPYYQNVERRDGVVFY